MSISFNHYSDTITILNAATGANTANNLGGVGTLNVSSNVAVTGNITLSSSSGGITFGDGTRQITAAQTKFTKTLTSTAPSNPIEGDTWYDTTTGVWSLYVAAGNGVTSSGWIEIGRP